MFNSLLADTKAELAFRDWLREHPSDVMRYAQVKRELAGRFKNDREAYTAAKGEFIQQILMQIKTNGQGAT